MTHVVRTTHVQRLIRNGLALAEQVNGQPAGATLVPPLTAYSADRPPSVDQALGKAAADLRHAAEELEAERLSCYGWAQQ